MRRAAATKTRVHDLMRRLCELSVEHSYDPYRAFDWPACIPDDCLWMSPELISFSGTRHMDELTGEQVRRLSRWELVNFFSFNVHGIRELMLHVLSCIYKSGQESTSEYFHHFLDEENKHMWFFAEFCKRYGGKIYFTQKMQFPAFAEDDIQVFVGFAKILISEQVSDFYNVRMMADDALPAIVREINRQHHEDETRHIAMGLHIVDALYEDIIDKYPEETRRRIEAYLARYMQFFVESFYNPSAYRDAGLEQPYEWRKRLIDAPGRRAFHEQVLRKPANFFHDHGIGTGERHVTGQ